ncbi:MAG: phosphofructokinase [Firmicutes bacterium]|nr:phosphofructokinase [Bacillota bacterium]
MELIGKALIAQGGGPTAVINQSMAGIVAEARKYKQITTVYGALRGVEGLINEDFIDLTQETSFNLDQVAQTPSSALFSTRVKPDANYCKEIFKVLKAHDIRYFFYIGGNDSADTVHIISEEAKLDNYEFRAIHVPKTIDNDLLVNDHTPGYSSAARFVTQAFSGINLDMKALSGIYIGVVMGRNAGFLTAAAAGAQKFTEDGPHLIYLPERPFIIENFVADIKKVYEQYGYCIVAVSEGIKDISGTPIIVSLLKDIEKDAHGNITLSGTGALGDLLTQTVKQGLGISRVRSDTFGYIQRCFPGCVSDVDQHEAREAGEKAVQFALSTCCNGSITIHRIGDYAVEYKLTPLAELAGKTKYMPDDFINPAGNHVTDAFKNYLRPLLGSNLPSIAKLIAPKVPKILRKD